MNVPSRHRNVGIRARITLTLATTGLVLFGTYSVHRLVIEKMNLLAATQHEVQMLGRSLQVAVENALRDSQGEDIQETLVKIEALEPTVDILVYHDDKTLIASSEGSQ